MTNYINNPDNRQYRPISCDKHDYLEIACLYGYTLGLTLRDGSIMVVRAQTTKTAADKVEYLVVDADGSSIEIPMHELKQIQTMTPGAVFERVVFD